jgi:hypothetical protein
MLADNQSLFSAMIGAVAIFGVGNTIAKKKNEEAINDAEENASRPQTAPHGVAANS